jgi:broad specificity phosphatase PhoE
MAERAYLIRHGQTDWNTNGRWQGLASIALNATGRKQAHRLAAYLSRNPIGAVYCSDLPRAYETARILADALGLTPIVDPRWRELDIGAFQGLTQAEIGAQYPAEYAAFLQDPLDYVLPEGESRRQLQARAWAAWNDATSAANARQIAIVAHGGTFKLLLMKLFDGDAQRWSDVEFPNTSLTVIERQGGPWVITDLAITPHLDGTEPPDSAARHYF